MTEVSERLRRRRQLVENRLGRRQLLHTVSIARLQLREAVEDMLRRYATGAVLEAGAGRSPYSPILIESGCQVTSLDIDPGPGIDIVGDIQAMDAVPSETFDTVFSTQVLEHVPRPSAAMAEFARVLKPGGVLILSAPHLSMIHEAPRDYYRYTGFGLHHLCESNGLQMIGIRPVGGLLSFIGHTASLAWLTTVGAIPGLFWPAWILNYLFLVRGVGLLDRAVGLQAIMPRDHILVARRV